MGRGTLAYKLSHLFQSLGVKDNYLELDDRINMQSNLKACADTPIEKEQWENDLSGPSDYAPKFPSNLIQPLQTEPNPPKDFLVAHAR